MDLYLQQKYNRIHEATDEKCYHFLNITFSWKLHDLKLLLEVTEQWKDLLGEWKIKHLLKVQFDLFGFRWRSHLLLCFAECGHFDISKQQHSILQLHILKCGYYMFIFVELELKCKLYIFLKWKHNLTLIFLMWS